MSCCTFHPHNLLINGNLYPLTPFTCPIQPFPLWQPPIWSLCLRACFLCILRIPYVGEIILHLFLFVWLISFNLMPSKSIHIVTNGKILFFIWLKYVCVPHFLYTFVCQWAVRCGFHILAIVNNAAVNRGAHILSSQCFCFLWIDCRSGNARSYGSSVFKFLRKLHIVFDCDYTHLYPTSSAHKCSLSFTSSPTLFSQLFDTAILIGLKVLICISLLISVELLFM